MKMLVVYDSQFGNTGLIAEELASVLEEYGEVSITRVQDAEPLIFSGEDLLVMGCPTIAHGLSPEMKRLLENARGREEIVPRPRALAFDTRINWPKWLSGSAADKIAGQLEEMGCLMLARPESFIVTGGEGPLAEGERQRAAAWVGAALRQEEFVPAGA